MRVAVLGAGNWGTTYAKVLVDAGNEVTLWARRAVVAEAIEQTHVNPDYLPGIELPDLLRATHDPGRALRDAELVAIAVTSQSLRENLASWAPLLPPGAVLISLMKGVELGTTKRMTEVIAEVAGAPAERIAVVSGPNLALEIAHRQPTATVVACTDESTATLVQQASTTSYFRPYTNTDVIGCELGGAVKNVIALACGMAQGMGFGDNTNASLITRGLAETARLGVALGADPLTFAGLAGLGDLVATCNSPLSRNRSFGERLGRGESLQQAQDALHGQVAEGRQVLPVGARPRPPARGRGADHRRRRGGVLPVVEPADGGGVADVTFHQERGTLAVPGAGTPIGSGSMTKIRVAVVYGGRSSEHGISVVSAGSVISALDPERYEVVPIGIKRDGALGTDRRRCAVHAHHRTFGAFGRRRHGRGAAGRSDGQGARLRRAGQRRAGAGVGRRGVPGAARPLRRGRHDPGAARDGRGALRRAGRVRQRRRDGQGVHQEAARRRGAGRGQLDGGAPP